MPKHNYYFLLFLMFGFSGNPQAEELSQLQTLFTTAQERLLINSNRYKGDEKPVGQVMSPEPEAVVEAVKEVIKEAVTVKYQISGVSTNKEGSKTAWVNGKPYESGEFMDDGTKIRVNNTTVIITTLDGINHSAISGEVLDLTYLKPVEQ